MLNISGSGSATQTGSSWTVRKYAFSRYLHTIRLHYINLHLQFIQRMITKVSYTWIVQCQY